MANPGQVLRGLARLLSAAGTRGSAGCWALTPILAFASPRSRPHRRPAAIRRLLGPPSRTAT